MFFEGVCKLNVMYEEYKINKVYNIMFVKYVLE